MLSFYTGFSVDEEENVGGVNTLEELDGGGGEAIEKMENLAAIVNTCSVAFGLKNVILLVS